MNDKDKQYHAWLIETARIQYEQEGQVELDDHPKTSMADEGARIGSYVAAWVWVDNPCCLLCEELILGTPVFDNEDAYCKQCYLKRLLKEEE